MRTSDTSHLDYRSLLRESKRLDVSHATAVRRLAVLSDAAVPQLVPLLKVLFARQGVRAEVYLAEFGATALEVFDAASGLYAFAPDVIVMLPALNALRLDYYREVDDREHFADRVATGLAGLWDTIHARSPAAVVLQGNFVPPYERQFGNFDHLVLQSFCAQVARLDVAIADRARTRTHVLVNDVAGLAARVGLRHWFDERLWALAKAFCALDQLPLVAQNVVDLVMAQHGQTVKCVVVDLDDTLWSGTIGDDGLEGIEMDAFGHGEPHHRLQHYLRELARRGIVLAVCSKNDHAVAIEAFRRHPDMVLREEDIAVFVANWGPKPDNIRQIQQTLNIGLDAMVFLDDSPFERQLVRDALPEVIVPELPADAVEYVQFLSELNLFEATSFSAEDRQRSAAYRANARRAEASAGFSDITAYLRSLDMRIAMRPFDAFALPRIAQLLQRSNQFNLTTRRHLLPQCEAMLDAGSGYLPFYLTLTDRFGDNGLVSVVILRDAGDALEIDSWVMSCRVLARGVEAFAMNRVVETARARGREWVTGTYLPTAKNGMVQGFFAQFGFEPVATRADGGTTWRLRVSSYSPRVVCLSEESA